MVDGSGLIFKECFLKIFIGNSVVRLILYVKNDIIKMIVGKIVDYVFNKMVIIQKWFLNVMFLLYCDEFFKFNLIVVQIFVVINDGISVKVEDLIFFVKDSVYDGRLIFL